jgi:cytochrome P450
VTASSSATTPANPIDAVTHADPSAYYATIAGQPPSFVDALQMWIVGSAADVSAVLSNPSARVRPLGQSCPAHLGDDAAAATFQRIARMNDGADHAAIRQLIDAWFAALTPDQIDDACRAAINDVPHVSDHRSMIEQWMRVYPCAVMVRLMNIDAHHIPALVTAAEALAAAFGPGAGPDTTGPADQAIATITDALDEPRKPMGNSLVHIDDRSDNGGSQTIQHVLRSDLPIHNTRRFAHADFALGDTQIKQGDTILVVLAAASGDPAADEQVAFGAGVHRCPAHTLARTICRAAVAAIVDRLDGAAVPDPIGYRTRQNARIPQFSREESLCVVKEYGRPQIGHESRRQPVAVRRADR